MTNRWGLRQWLNGGALARLGLLNHPQRGPGFIYILLYFAFEVGVFLVVVNTVIWNYYQPILYDASLPGSKITPESAQFDYVMHHVLFMVHVVTTALSSEMALWIAVYATGALLRWILCGGMHRVIMRVGEGRYSASSRTIFAANGPDSDSELSGKWLHSSKAGTGSSGQPSNAPRTRRIYTPDDDDLNNNSDPSTPPSPAVLASPNFKQQQHQHQHQQLLAGLGERESNVAAMCCLSPWTRELVCRVLNEVESLVLMTLQAILVVSCVLESRLLAEMSVHFIDLDLVNLLGIRTVLKRQRILGAGLNPEHWKYIKLLVAALVIIQISVYLFAHFIYRRISTPPASTDASLPVSHADTPQRKPISWRRCKRFHQAFIACFVIVVVMSFVIPYQPHLLSMRVHHFRSQLPFNFFDTEVNKELISIASRTTTSYPPDGEGYPIIYDPTDLGDDDDQDLSQANKPSIQVPTIKNRQNIIIIMTESWRMEEGSDRNSPYMTSWVKEQNCLHSKMHVAPGHVTELAWFSVVYSMYPMFYHVFSTEHIPSYPMEVMKENGYRTATFSSSTPWSYPTTNTLDNFQEVYDLDHNGQIMKHMDDYLERHKGDTGPYYFIVKLHKPEKEYFDAPELNGISQEERDIKRDILKDVDRMNVIQKLNASGLLTNSMLIFTGDHGDMLGEHGEQGHGQKEGSWWREKAEIPFYLCLPDQQEKMNEFNLAPSLTTHLDIVPTIMNYLDITPELDPKVYALGQNILLPANEDVAPDRAIATNARYFPRKNKINAFITQTEKWWWRVIEYERHHHQRKMRFAIEMHTNRYDEASECDLTVINHNLTKIFTANADGLAPETTLTSTTEDPCHTAAFLRYAKSFQEDFWRFSRDVRDRVHRDDDDDDDDKSGTATQPGQRRKGQISTATVQIR